MKSNYLLNIYPFRPLSRDALEALKPSSHKIFGDRVTISKDPDSAWTVVEAKEPGAKGNLGESLTLKVYFLVGMYPDSRYRAECYRCFRCVFCWGG